VSRRDTGVILVIIILMLLVRAPLAPYTSGSDIAQFAGFADTFLRHHFCFFKYTGSGNFFDEGWPYPWPYVYGPGLILFLSLLRMIVSSPITHYHDRFGYHVLIPKEWILATKSLFISFDILAALMIYLVVRSFGYTRRTAFLLTSLYAFNPVSIYISSIYGMFDQIPLFFFLAGVYLLYLDKGNKHEMRNRILGSFLTGISVAFKQTFMAPFLIILYDILLRKSGKIKKATLIIAMLLGILILFIPFLMACPDSIASFLKTSLSSTRPTYNNVVLPYNFNGITNLVVYIHAHAGKNYYSLLSYWWILAMILIDSILVVYIKYRDPLVFSGLSYIVFIATYWRINYQYLVPAVGFTVIILAKLWRSKRIVTLGLIYISLIGLWFFMYPVSWWTHVHITNPNKALWHALDKLSLMIFDDEPYLFYSIILTIIEYLLSIEVIIYAANREADIVVRKK